MIKVNSTVKLNFPKINQLTRAQVAALEQTAEDLHTEVEQAQVFPRDTGALQNESTFVDTSESSHGKVSIISSTPYARRLYFHPEFHFKKDKNPNAKGKWYEDWLPGGKNADLAVEAYKVAIGGPQLESYGTKYVTLLVHWNKSQRETEKAGKALFEAVRATRNATVNHETIKFVLPVYDLQDIGVDDSGIYEMVIELAVIFEKKGNKDEE